MSIFQQRRFIKNTVIFKNCHVFRIWFSSVSVVSMSNAIQLINKIFFIFSQLFDW